MAEDLLEETVSTTVFGLSSTNLGASIIVSNPVPWVRSDVVRIRIDRLSIGEGPFEIRFPSGESVPYQIVEDESEETHLVVVFFAEDIPSLGQCVYSIEQVDKHPEFDTGLKSGRGWIESDNFVLEFDEFNGGISRFYDKMTQNEVIGRHSASISIDNDVGDLYRYAPSTLVSMESQITSERSPAKFSIVDEGSVRIVAEILSTLAGTEIQQRVTMYHKIRRVDVEIEMKFKGNNRRIRYNLPLQIFTQEVHTGAQFNVERRITQKPISYEFADHGFGSFHALDWVDASGPEFGLCLTTIGLHEFEFRDGLLSTTLLRAVSHLSHGIDDDVLETPLGNENNTHSYRMSLIPHSGDWKEANVHKMSAEHRMPVIAYQIQGGVAEKPLEKSFLDIEGIDLDLTCFKPAFDDSEYILRFNEYCGESGQSTITFSQKVRRVVLLDLLENEIGALESNGSSIVLRVDPYSIITVKVVLE
jgi:alpha-mannosidase